MRDGEGEAPKGDDAAVADGSDAPRGSRRRKRRRRRATRAAEKTHCVYVIRLDEKVLDDRSFRKENPLYGEGKPCAYVGMTGLTPEERFERHRAGRWANKYVREFGLYLMHRKFKHLKAMTREKAAAMEVRLAERLRKKGWAVWQK